MDEGDRPAAFFGRVVKPFVSPDCDAVVAGEAAFPAFPQKMFAPAEEKGFQIHGGGPLFLAVGKFDIGHGHPPFKIQVPVRR